MVSKLYDLAEAAKKDGCIRFLLAFIMIGVIAVAVLVGIYAFNSTGQQFSGCRHPVLDSYGLSNWTVGAKKVAFGCFPGHQIEGHEGEVVVSECINKEWIPEPPACAALPIRLDCLVNQNGFEGTISMWQKSNTTPTYVYGFLNTTNVDKNQVVILESIELSRNTCAFSSDNTNNSMPEQTPTELHFQRNQIEICFDNTMFLAYKKVDLRLTMVFIDIPTDLTAVVVSAHQGQETLVMKLPVPFPSSGWSFNRCQRNISTVEVEHDTDVKPTSFNYFSVAGKSKPIQFQTNHDKLSLKYDYGTDEGNFKHEIPDYS